MVFEDFENFEVIKAFFAFCKCLWTAYLMPHKVAFSQNTFLTKFPSYKTPFVLGMPLFESTLDAVFKATPNALKSASHM